MIWDLIPQDYKDEDQNQDHVLEKYTEGVRPSFDEARAKVECFEDIRDPLKTRTQFSEVSRIKLGPRVVTQVDAEQRGHDAQISALQEFISKSARFRDEDLGKEITVRASQVTGNNRTVIVAALVDLNTVLTTPPLMPDAGPLIWELRPPSPTVSDQFTVEVRGGDAQKVAPGWILNDGYADFQVLARRQFAVTGSRAGLTEKEGDDGYIDSSNKFRSELAKITGSDIGKWLIIYGALAAANNDKFEITDVDVSTSPPSITLAGFVRVDPGPFHWSLMPFAQIDVQGAAFLNGMVEQEGFDASVTAASPNIRAATGLFKLQDIGKYLVLRNSIFGQSGERQITGFVDENTVQVAAAFATSESGLYWCLRSPTATGDVEKSGKDLSVESVAPGASVVRSFSHLFLPTDEGMSLEISQAPISSNDGTHLISDVLSDTEVVLAATLTVDPGPAPWKLLSGDATKVQVHAESLLEHLAPDFGIEIDTQENEDRQRSWVANVTRWIDRKGHRVSYQTLGLISGFNVSIYALYRILPEFSGGLPVESLFELGEVEAGRRGSDGLLTAYGYIPHHGDPLQIKYAFLSPTGKFRGGDVGRQIRITNAVNPSNDKLFTVEQYLSETVLFVREMDEPLVPDFGIGGGLDPITGDPIGTLGWTMTKLFTLEPPSRPLFDEMNADALAYWIANNLPLGDEFLLDMFCWEDTFAAFVNITVLGVASVTPTLWTVTVSGPADVVVESGRWKLQTSSDQEFVLESLPVADGVNWKFNVLAMPTAPPSLGVGKLQYMCTTELVCGYSAASELLLVAEEGTIANEKGLAIERSLERLLLRLVEVVPIHVELLPRFRRNLGAHFNLRATISAGLEIYQPLLAPFTYYFDLFPADIVPLDRVIYATITPPP